VYVVHVLQVCYILTRGAHVRMYMCLYVCTYVCMHVRIVYPYICMFVRTYVCMYVCVLVSTYIPLIYFPTHPCRHGIVSLCRSGRILMRCIG